MEIALDAAQIGTGLGAAVPPLTLWMASGVPSFVLVETAERPTLVSLLIGGRLRPDAGAVRVDGASDAAALRRRTALVDTPVVAEPTPGVSLAGVVAEEFVFAGRSGSRAAVRDFLASHDLLGYAKVAVRSLPPANRVRLFSELALLRDGVESLVVTSPERHGGEPGDWYPALAAIAERGITVAIVTDAATADQLAILGARDATDIPVPPEPEAIEEPEDPEEDVS